jgi:hypothetical protein
VVYFEKWGLQEDPDWNKIYDLIRTNLDYAFM